MGRGRRISVGDAATNMASRASRLRPWWRWWRWGVGAAFVVVAGAIPLSFIGYARVNSSNTEPVVTLRLSCGLLTFKHFGDARGGRVFMPPLAKGVSLGWSRDEPNAVGWRWLPEWTTGPIPSLPEQVVRVPLWMPAVVLVVPLARAWWRESRKRHPGACAACGYDLSGLEARVVCPECGTAKA